MSISIAKISSLGSSFESHQRNHRWHPPILIHKLWQPTFFSMECHWILHQLQMQSTKIFFFNTLMNIVWLFLTSIVKFRFIFVFICISVLSLKGVRLCKPFRWLFTYSVSLLGEGLYSNILIESLAFYDKF